RSPRHLLHALSSGGGQFGLLARLRLGNPVGGARREHGTENLREPRLPPHGIMTRPRVVFLSPRFPFPPDRGDRLHAFHVVRALSRRFETTVASFEEGGRPSPLGVRPLQDWGVRARPAPLPLGSRLLRLGSSVLSGQPPQVVYYPEPAMTNLLEEV